MGDDFERWRKQDITRAVEISAALHWWEGYLRHSATEPIANEVIYTEKLSRVLLKFGAERLGWTAQPPLISLLDSLTVVKGAFIDEVLAGAIPGYGQGIQRIPMDGKYYLPSQRDAWRIIEWSQVNTIPWQAEQYDCDDHAEALRGDFRRFGVNSCGFIVDWSGGHAYNVLPFADGQFWFLEPQADRIIAIGEGIYKMTRADILL